MFFESMASSNFLKTSLDKSVFKVFLSPLLKALIIVSKAILAPSKNCLWSKLFRCSYAIFNLINSSLSSGICFLISVFCFSFWVLWAGFSIAFSYPVVPKGEARIRVQISANHTKSQLNHALDAFLFYGEKYKII